MLQYTVSSLESIKSIRLYVNAIHNAKEIDLLAGDRPAHSFTSSVVFNARAPKNDVVVPTRADV